MNDSWPTVVVLVVLGAFVLEPVLLGTVRAVEAQGVSATMLAVDDAPEIATDTLPREIEWRLERLTSAPQVSDDSASIALATLRDALFEVDFARCLAVSRSQRLDVDQLLADRDRESAAVALTVSSICAYQAGDEALATEFLTRIAVGELEPSEELRFAPPALQTIATQARRSSRRVAVEVHTIPDSARVWVDGRELPCTDGICRASLPAGDHALSAEAFGFRRRVQRIAATHDSTWSLALDPDSSEGLRVQLSLALRTGIRPDSATFLRGASSAYGSRLVVVLWNQPTDGTRAALFDARDPMNVLAARAVTDPVTAVSDVVALWRRQLPRPLVRRPAFWVGLLVSMAAAAGAAVLGIHLKPDATFRLVAL